MVKEIDFQQASDELEELALAPNQNATLLVKLRDKIVRALEAGATVKDIWASLRKSGFSGNIASLSIWLDREGIRPRTKKAPNGSRKAQSNDQAQSGLIETGDVSIKDDTFQG